MSNWNASNYRQRKAERLIKAEPRWATNPETGEKFYLRPVSAVMSSILAGHLPSSLTAMAVQKWKEQGVAGLEDPMAIASQLTPEQIADGQREMKRLSEIIQSSCVIPYLSNEHPDKIDFSEEWKAQAVRGLTEVDPEFKLDAFDPKQLVLDPRDLDDKDAAWLFKWAAGIVSDVSLKGGGAMQMDDLSRFRKKLARGSRTKSAGKQVRAAS